PGHDDAQQGEAEHDGDGVEGIVVGHDLRLLTNLAIQQTQGRFSAAQMLGQQRQALGGGGVARGHVAAQDVEVVGRPAVQHRGQHGNAHGTAQIAQDAVETGGGARLGWRNHRGGDDGQGHQHQGRTHRTQYLDGDELIPGKIRIQGSAEETAGGKQQKAGRADEAWRDVPHQDWHQRNQQQLRQAQPHDHLTDLQGVVALDLCQVHRQHEYRPVESDPQPYVGQTAEQEVALGQQPQVDQMIVPRQLQDDEARQTDQRDAAEGDYVARFQPVLPMAFLETHLQAAQTDRHGDYAGIVTLAQQLPARGAAVQPVEQPQGHECAGDHVDVEDPFPAEILGQPAADGGADGGGEGGGDGEQRHALGAYVQRQLGQHQGEGEGDKGAPGQSLQHPEHDHALQAPGHGAEQGGDDKEHRDADRKTPW